MRYDPRMTDTTFAHITQHHAQHAWYMTDLMPTRSAATWISPGQPPTLSASSA